MTVKTFALFITVMVVQNFLMAVTWFPASIVLWERHIKGAALDHCGLPTLVACASRLLSPADPTKEEVGSRPLFSWRRYAELLQSGRYVLLVRCVPPHFPIPASTCRHPRASA
jgi:hypothetical protein